MRNLIAPVLLFALGIAYFFRSGVQPDFTIINYETGMAFTIGALFLLVDRLMTGNPNKSLENEIRELRAEIEALRDE